MIIEVVGKEIEKIKGDFESYLNGLNMVGEISYSQYSELYDEGTKQIQRAYELGRAELEQENAELKADNDARKFAMVMSEKVEKQLRKENAEMKGIKDVATLIRANNDTVVTLMQLNNMLVSKNQQLTTAKEIIREFVKWANWQGNSKCPSFKSIQDKAEQFLNSEVEK